jgi:hypothetical protein
MAALLPESHPGADPLAQLERAFIDEFLRMRGYDVDTLRQLPDDKATALLKQATMYASCRLTEVESRARFVDDLHDSSHDSAGHLRGHNV